MKTDRWTCDKCKKEISDASAGWVQWLSPPDAQARNLSLVHRRTECQFDQASEYRRDEAIVGDTELSRFLGTTGLMDMLSEIRFGRWELASGLEMVKRLHVPGYERAHRHIARAISAGVFEPNTDPLYCSEADLEAVHRWLDEQE